ncbi:LLM class F420-dependent oxidoreductase [Acidiferrimicrobium sp. IK]|uniref:LLM class F420-dependent oxidoreductase n=1 Tax=Acidiferrimicrobium sp. IK TaxID=2871700 RepID=UPI003967053C|nr:LLM class F420-dependent oxidoreductase [Acidiferrimicrobium sp. IK]
MTVPLDDVPLTEQGEVARALAGAGYTDLWSSEAMGADCFVPLAVAAASEPTLRLGTAIAPVYTRGPACLAQSAATLAATAPGRFVLGVGSSSQLIVQGWNDKVFDRPYHRTRDVVRFLRKAFAGERVDEAFDTFEVRGFRLGIKADPAPPVLVAALRSGMLAMAGREADGAIINWLSAADVATVAPIVHAAGPGKEIVARILVMPTADADAARAAGRRLIATYLNVPVYAEFHRWLGRDDDLAPMWKLWAEGNRREAAAAVPDHVVDELILHGPPEACQEQVLAYVEQGVTTPVLSILPTGDDPRQVAVALAPA